jgi:hypothetical protein
MYPAFRSNRSALAFCLLLIFLLALPVILSWMPPLSDEQEFISMSNQVGPIGWDAQQIYEDPKDADVVFLGSSRIMEGIRADLVEKSFSAHLGRPAHIAMLALNWPGEDLHYYMLRDYLQHHHAALIVWNLPQPGSFTNEPHVQSSHWVRFDRNDNTLSSLPLRDRLSLYCEMVFGAPRALLAKIRPNLIGDDEKTFAAYGRYKNEDPERRLGYYGTPFVQDSMPVPSIGDGAMISVNSPLLDNTGPYPEPYQLHYIQAIVDLAKQHGSKLVFLHLPTVEEFGDTTLPEIASWSQVIGPDYSMIGVPGDVLFAGVTRERLPNLFANHNHFNRNGSTWFTETITPALLKAYGSNQ